MTNPPRPHGLPPHDDGRACEVAVVGGGPAGAVAALTLARAGRRVVIVDDRPRADGRSSYRIGETLPPAARPLLRDLGLWSGFPAGAHLRCTGTYAAWGTADLHDHSNLLDPHGHGWHLDRAAFDTWLLDTAVAAGARLLRGSAVRYLDDTAGRTLLVRTGGTVTHLGCSGVVDASGRRAVIGRHLGTRRRQDRLMAVSLLFTDRRPDADARDRELRTLVEAVPGGWWYTAKVPAGRLVAHLTDADLAARELRTPEGFLEHVARTRHLAPRLRGYDLDRLPAPRWTPAHGVRLTPATGPGWLAVGDAALAFDPLSSQGILTALHTGYRGALALDLHLRGTSGARTAYTDFLDGIADAYHRHHADSYAQERRWAHGPFWRRRRRPGGPAAAVGATGTSAATAPATGVPRTPTMEAGPPSAR